MAAEVRRQPVLILGGFLITSEAYQPLQRLLQGQMQQAVECIPASRFDWLLTSVAPGWRRLLDRVAERAEVLAQRSPTGRITLIGHSSGGVMLRLFLANDAFQGRCYNGRQWTDRLYTLGSPHTALRATPLRQMVDRRYPGAWFRDTVRYISVAGSLPPGEGSAISRRMAGRSYRAIAGEADLPGDGLVPVCAASLQGAETIVLPGVAHSGAFGSSWYGSEEVVPRWWRG